MQAGSLEGLPLNEYVPEATGQDNTGNEQDDNRCGNADKGVVPGLRDWFGFWLAEMLATGMGSGFVDVVERVRHGSFLLWFLFGEPARCTQMFLQRNQDFRTPGAAVVSCKRKESVVNLARQVEDDPRLGVAVHTLTPLAAWLLGSARSLFRWRHGQLHHWCVHGW
jgi:hypothetical protein